MGQSSSTYLKVVESRIKDISTTSKNTQANAICERMHQKVGNMSQTLLHGQPPQHVTGSQAKKFIDDALSITMHTMHVGTHSTLGSSPDRLVVNRDMFLNIPLIAETGMPSQNDENMWLMRTLCMRIGNIADIIMLLTREY